MCVCVSLPLYIYLYLIERRIQESRNNKNTCPGMVCTIGLTGRMSSGKSTVAGLICEIDSSFTEMSFAAPLKQSLSSLVGEAVDKFETSGGKQAICPALGITRRRAMQQFGDALRESFGCGIFVDLARSSARHVLSGQRSVVLSDCRFPAEADMIRSMGGIIVCIQRANVQSSDSVASAHASEVLMDTIRPDLVLNNNGTIDELRQSVEVLLRYPPTAPGSVGS